MQFGRFHAMLREAGYIVMSGLIFDSSLIAAPKQRNSREEKDQIKAGRILQDWREHLARPIDVTTRHILIGCGDIKLACRQTN